MLTFRLDKNIECEKICQEIQKLIEKKRSEVGSQDLSGSLVVISIKDSTDATSNYHIPKIEYKLQ